MSEKYLLIDATHAEEMRVAVVKDDRLEDFEVETADKAQNKGNIYVATISRVEPSLQAAFITYGGERNGFLAFGELHPEFFDVPAKEKKELLQEMADVAERRKNRFKNKEDDLEDPAEKLETQSHAELSEAEQDEDARALALANSLESPDDASLSASKKRSGRFKRTAQTEDASAEEETSKEDRKPPIHRRYKIQNVLKEGQKILVQVVKEERGNKGAALTTYFALPGRYTVLMPNTPLAGGISRKINDYEDRQELKEVYNTLEIPQEMGLIIRTAGVGQDKKDIQKDYKNLTSLWKNIQKEFKKIEDITCVHEDGSIVIRTLRDMMQDDIKNVIIAGKSTYKQAKDYMKTLMPDVAKITKEHQGDTPLFVEYGVEDKLSRMHHARVNLPSGGYLVINPTEALVSIDVNSGRNTHQKNIEETAYQTNLEAAEEVARQMRLRDLAGLIVIDFIDMGDYRHIRAVERLMRKVIRRDRARTQVGSISSFGLMEISRQRLRPSYGESNFVTCQHCSGSGLVHSLASSALMLLRRLAEAETQKADRVVLHTSTEAVVYILNHKRSVVRDMEAKYKYQILLRTDEQYQAPDHKIELIHMKADGSEKAIVEEVSYKEDLEEKAPKPKRGRRAPKKDAKPRAKKDARTDTKKPASKPETRSTEAKKDTREPRPSGHGGRGRRPSRPTKDVSSTPKAQEAKPTKVTPTAVKKPKPAPKKRTPKAVDKPIAVATVKADTSAVKVKKPVAPKALKIKKEAVKVTKSKPVMVQTVSNDGKAKAGKSAPAPAAKKPFQRWWSKA